LEDLARASRQNNNDKKKKKRKKKKWHQIAGRSKISSSADDLASYVENPKDHTYTHTHTHMYTVKSNT
jgi:hypothetical protein